MKEKLSEKLFLNNKYYQRRKNHRCVICNKTDQRTLGGKVYCSSCAKKYSSEQKKYRDKAREENRCYRCGKPTDLKKSGEHYRCCKSCRIKETKYLRKYRNKGKNNVEV